GRVRLAGIPKLGGHRFIARGFPARRYLRWKIRSAFSTDRERERIRRTTRQSRRRRFVWNRACHLLAVARPIQFGLGSIRVAGGCVCVCSVRGDPAWLLQSTPSRAVRIHRTADNSSCSFLVDTVPHTSIRDTRCSYLCPRPP